MAKGTPTPWSYFFIRLLFRFVLKIFYGTIVIENADLIPETGKPCVVCANHSNSLTDALLLVTSIPPKKRNMLRLTAKATQFGRRTFTSWLIESAGTVPIMRRKDYTDGEVDNSQTMAKLMVALDLGDAVCLFPEGMSRYHPTIAPLKTGVARLISDVLSRNRNDPDFAVYLQTASVTYMHRQHFRSDVLITFHPPTRFSVGDNPELLAPVDYNDIRNLTSEVHAQIGSGTLDSPSWRLIRASKLAARIYAPLGTLMTLGDHVRVVRVFLEAFKDAAANPSRCLDSSDEKDGKLITNASAVNKLCQDLQNYQDQISGRGLKDDRVRIPLPRHTIVYRMTVRLLWSLCLLAISFPGFMLWVPIFATTFYAVHNFKKTGPIFDTWDEIAQYKLVYGFISGIVVWLSATLITLPLAGVTFFAIPVVMWLSLRWIEDAVSSFRAFTSLYRLLLVGRPILNHLRIQREGLRQRVSELAERLHLPANPEEHFVETGGQQKGKVKGYWDSNARYFSLKRRRKRDWNETLRLYDKVDYPEDDS